MTSRYPAQCHVFAAITDAKIRLTAVDSATAAAAARSAGATLQLQA